MLHQPAESATGQLLLEMANSMGHKVDSVIQQDILLK
jgi:hypothetical protein